MPSLRRVWARGFTIFRFGGYDVGFGVQEFRMPRVRVCVGLGTGGRWRSVWDIQGFLFSGCRCKFRGFGGVRVQLYGVVID